MIICMLVALKRLELVPLSIRYGQSIHYWSRRLHGLFYLVFEWMFWVMDSILFHFVVFFILAMLQYTHDQSFLVLWRFLILLGVLCYFATLYLRQKNLNRLLLAHININSIRNKFDQLVSSIKNNIDILMISETKIDNSFPTMQFHIEDTVFIG